MSFSTKPVVKNLTEEEKQKILNKYGYSEMYTYDVAFLGESKDIILANVPEEIRADVKKRMDKIETFIIGDRKNVGLSNLCQENKNIHMDIGHADISADSFELKPESEYITTIIVHELLHAASNPKVGTTGIVEKIEDGKRRKNVGLNEGITQFLAEKYTGRTVEPDNYSFHKKAVGLLADVIGADFIQTAYLTNDVNALRTKLNQVAGNDTFFDEFAAQLDTINRLTLATKKIKKGLIEPKDPESVARMEAVLEASQDKLSEMLFVNVVLPTISAEPLQSRQTKLLELFQNNPKVLDGVSKYIPLVKNQVSEGSVVFVDLTNEKLTMIAEEIKSNGMTFDTVKKQADRVKDCGVLGKGVARDILSAADNFYKENEAKMNKRNNGLTPFLERELSHYVDIYMTLEETAANTNDENVVKSVEGYKNFIKHYFHKIEDIDIVIDNMITTKKEAKKNNPAVEEEVIQPVVTPKKTTPVTDEELDLIFEENGTKAEELGKQLGKQAAEEPLNRADEYEKKMPSIADDFIINNVTGEVIDLRSKSIPEKIQAVAKSVGEEYKLENDPYVSKLAREKFEMIKATLLPQPGTPQYQKIVDKFTDTNKLEICLVETEYTIKPGTPQYKELQKQFKKEGKTQEEFEERIEELKKSLQEGTPEHEKLVDSFIKHDALNSYLQSKEEEVYGRFEAGFKLGYTSVLGHQVDKGLEQRTSEEAKLAESDAVVLDPRPLTAVEIKVIMENVFEEVKDDGSIILINKETNKEVKDVRTMAAYQFGKEVTYAFGEVTNEAGETRYSVQNAFTEENMPVISAFLKVSKEQVEKAGFVDISQVSASENTDERIVKLAERFDRNQDVLENVGRVQTKNAKTNPHAQEQQMGDDMGPKK